MVVDTNRANRGSAAASATGRAVTAVRRDTRAATLENFMMKMEFGS
jgi:hypothetical protein